MDEDLLPLMKAAKYLGISNVKLSQLAREGFIRYATSPLDRRLKLFRRQDLDTLRQAQWKHEQTATSSERSEI